MSFFGFGRFVALVVALPVVPAVVLAVVLAVAACGATRTDVDMRIKEKPATTADICARGVGAACAQLASQAKGKEAERLHDQACSYGVPASCFAEARLVEADGDVVHAIALDRRACDGKIGGACTDAGRLVQAQGGDPNADYEKGCDAKDGPGCWNLAVQLHEGPATNGERVRDLSDRACQGDVATACLFLGEETLKSAPERAAEKFKRACDLGDQDGCQLAAAKSPAEAARMRVELDCKAGDLTSCYNQAVSAEKRDPKAAAELYGRVCPTVPVACTNLGGLHERGQGVGKDKKRARELYRQACEAGEPIGCENHGEMLVAEHDLAGAMSDFKKACDAGARGACKRRAEVGEWKH